MRVPQRRAGVLVRQFGSGKVVNFSFAPNYTLGAAGRRCSNANVQKLYANAVRWAAAWTAAAGLTAMPTAFRTSPTTAST